MEIALPESLRREFLDFERRLRAAESRLAIGAGVTGLLVSWLLLYLSDRLWDSPPLLRLPLTLAGVAAVAAAGLWWSRRWLWRRPDLRDLSRLIQRRHVTLGDRLLGIVELAAQTPDASNVSPALQRAAIAQVAAEAGNLSFTAAVDRRQSRRALAVLTGIGAVCLAMAAGFPDAVGNAWSRWLQPIASIPRYTFVVIAGLPSHLIVAHGEPVELTAEVRSRGRLPATADVLISGQPPRATPITAGHLTVTSPELTRDTTVRLRVGDAHAAVALEPRHRPALTALQARIVYPDYLSRTPEQVAITAEQLRLLDSATVKFSLKTTRALAAASFSGAGTASLVVGGPGFETPELPAQGLGDCLFAWTDVFGLSGRQPQHLRIETFADQPPTVDCIDLARHTAIIVDETLVVDMRAGDDFGVRELTAAWRLQTAESTWTTQPVAAGSPEAEQVSGQFVLAPALQDIAAGTTVVLVARATDYLGDRPPSQSPEYLIRVLSHAEHADLVGRQFDALMADVEELIRQEEALMDAKLQLREEDAAARTAARKLADQVAAEHGVQERLREIQDAGNDLLREALRNKQIPTDIMAKLATTFNDMQQVRDGPLQEMIEHLQAGQRDHAERDSRLDQAVAKQREVIDDLRKMVQSLDESLSDLVARNFVFRLRQCAQAESEIASALQALLPLTVGLRPQDLDPSQREQTAAVAARQMANREEAGKIITDLHGFALRTASPDYVAVHDAMVDAKMDQSLAELAGTIMRNRTVSAIDLAGAWRDRFNAWADMLDASSGTAGDGEGSLTPEELKLLITLMRIVQAEDSLRTQTRALDENPGRPRQYRRQAQRLAREQMAQLTEVNVINLDVRQPMLFELLGRVGEVMFEVAEMLDEPRTDAAVIAAETEVIELLSKSCDSCRRQCAGSSSQCASMLMQMLPGMGSGPKGGGSMAGGAAETRESAAAGADLARRPGRRGERATGAAATVPVPIEFREALEAYFEAIEKLNTEPPR